MLSIAGRGGQYVLGTGDYRPRRVAGELVDLPWTTRNGEEGSDCAGAAICWAYQLRRHRRGFNRGLYATIADDINTDSCLEDARQVITRDGRRIGTGRRELFELADAPFVGALLVAPTIRLPSYYKMGHVRMVVGLGRLVAAEWDPARPRWAELELAEACGPARRAPGVIRTSGAAVARHNELWPRPEHRYEIVRVVGAD